MSRKKPQTQLSTTYMLSILAFSLVASIVLAAFWVGSEYRKHQSLSEEMDSRYLSATKERLVSEVERVIGYLEYEKANAEKRLKADIKARVYEAFALAEGIYQRHQGKIATDGIKKMVIEALRDIRFNNGRGYFFATRLDGNERLFADKPELEGRNLLDLQDTGGRYVIRDMIALVRANGEGYYRYSWTKPNVSGGGHPKIAYIKYFEPFDWLIGTGEYLQDVEQDIQAEVIDRIEQIRFGADGYIFVGNYDGLSLAKPAKNRNMWDLQDENGVKIVQELIASARSGGGFVNYVMPKFKGLPSAPKLSYADKFEAWQWYVGAGIYIDDIHEELDRKREELRAQIHQHLMMIAITLTGIVGLTFIVARLFTRRLSRTIQSFTQFFEKASSETTLIDTAKVNFREFEDLATSANRMVAARQSTDQALKESLEWNQTIFNAIQSGIVVIDVDTHRVVDVNPAAAAMFGRTRDDLIGHTGHEFIGPSQWGQCPLLDLDEGVDHEERQLVRPDGTTVPILKTVSRIDIGPKPYLIEAFLDISKQKKLEVQLQQAHKMEAIGTLTGGIAHDFNNILGIILGNTELAQSQMRAKDAVGVHLATIKEATLRAKKVVTQLLSYSRKTSSDMATVELDRIVDESFSFITALIPASITIRKQVTDEVCRIHGNATQIHQVLINLCVNASHAVDDEKGRIHLQLSKTMVEPGEFERFPGIGGAMFAEIIISDNGHGMPPEIQARIFDPYFTTKDVDKGTGMGLAVVLGIIRDHGGAIDVQSRMHQGTTVRVVLPLTAREPDVRPLPDLQSPSLGTAEAILFIDDEELLVRLGKDILKRLGYGVEAYTDVSQAMARFKASPEAFDLIITDMTMPGLSGMKVFETARNIRPDIPVIICSGYSDKIDEARSGALGCHYIQKPIELKKLADIVREALGKG